MKKKMSRRIKKKINRTGKFYCPICNNQEILVEHHINGRDIPNPNHKSNLAYICSNCHLKVHKGLILIEGWFMTTNGRELFWHNKNEKCFTGTISSPYIIPD